MLYKIVDFPLGCIRFQLRKIDWVSYIIANSIKLQGRCEVGFEVAPVHNHNH